MSDASVIPVPKRVDPDLEAELNQARQALVVADAELAQAQAEINAFRMHCRLKLDTVVDQYLELRARKQSLLTRLQLLRQADVLGIPFDSDDPFWQGSAESHNGASEDVDDPLLPTDTFRDKLAEKRLYRQLARRFHPDLGKTAVEIAYRTEMMSAINDAYQQSNPQALYDLAGQLDPAEIAQLSVIKNAQERSTRQKILKCRLLKRKAEQRLKMLMKENTARLWRLAKELEDEGRDWWEPVRLEIEEAIARRQKEIDAILAEIAEISIRDVENPGADFS